MLEALFFDHNGDFQAGTAAAVVALIGAIISAVFSWLSYKNSVKTAERQYIMEQKKIDADLKAKARIDWITQVRVQSADFITNCLLYLEYSSKTIVGKPTNVRVENIESNAVTITADVEPDEEVLSPFDDVIDDKEKEKIRVRLNNAANLLMIYFGPDKDGQNDMIVEIINEILNKVNSGKFYKNDTKSNDLIIKFRDEIRKYLKQEWNVAKDGK